MADVFLSYGREDKERIQIILSSLRSLELSVWSDARIGTGTHWDEVIEAELEKAKAVVVCWSQDAVRSHWVRSEAKFAQEHGKIVPCQLEPCKIPLHFQFDQAEDLSDWNGSGGHPGWRKILEAIGERVARPGLVDLYEALASGNNRDLLSWSQSFRDDPFAGKAFERVEKAERIHFEKELASANEKAKGIIKQSEENFDLAFQECSRKFSEWCSNIRNTSYDSLPIVWQALNSVSSTLARPDGETNQAELERDAALKRAAAVEDRLGALTKQRNREKFRLASGVALACVFSLLSGYFVHDKIDSSGQEVQALREKLNVALEERDKTTKSMSDLKSQFQTLQGENAKLAETEKILQSQLASSANAPSANSGLMREQLAAANKALQEERENSKAIAADLDNAKSRIIVLEQESNKSKENTVSNTVSLPVDYKDNLDNDRKKPFKLPDGKWSLEKKARCKLSFSGHDYIDGPCYYRSTPDRKWSIRAVGASKPHKAYWQVESGTARGYWNGVDAKSSETIESLEKDRSDKACWVSKNYRVCIY